MASANPWYELDNRVMNLFHQRYRLCATILCLLLSACISFSDQATDSKSELSEGNEVLKPQDDLTKFSTQNTTSTPQGWSFYRIAPFKKNTVYRLENYQGRTVLSANAKTSASGLAVKLKPKPSQHLWLKWEWKTSNLIQAANPADKQADDSPLRILVAFDGDKSKLGFKDNLTFELAHLMSGQELPYATLMYIWSNHHPVDTILNNPHTGRIKMIVVDSGPNKLNQWQLHERDLSADFMAAYGEKPGNVVGVALLTDTDNTKSEARSYYGDIELILKKYQDK
jgi:hypothetical protein